LQYNEVVQIRGRKHYALYRGKTPGELAKIRKFVKKLDERGFHTEIWDIAEGKDEHDYVLYCNAKVPTPDKTPTWLTEGRVWGVWGIAENHERAVGFMADARDAGEDAEYAVIEADWAKDEPYWKGHANMYVVYSSPHEKGKAETTRPDILARQGDPTFYFRGSPYKLFSTTDLEAEAEVVADKLRAKGKVVEVKFIPTQSWGRDQFWLHKKDWGIFYKAEDGTVIDALTKMVGLKED